jgi:hypothetical protein
MRRRVPQDTRSYSYSIRLRTESELDEISLVVSAQSIKGMVEMLEHSHPRWLLLAKIIEALFEEDGHPLTDFLEPALSKGEYFKDLWGCLESVHSFIKFLDAELAELGLPSRSIQDRSLLSYSEEFLSPLKEKLRDDLFSDEQKPMFLWFLTTADRLDERGCKGFTEQREYLLVIFLSVALAVNALFKGGTREIAYSLIEFAIGKYGAYSAKKRTPWDDLDHPVYAALFRLLLDTETSTLTSRMLSAHFLPLLHALSKGRFEAVEALLLGILYSITAVEDSDGEAFWLSHYHRGYFPQEIKAEVGTLVERTVISESSESWYQNSVNGISLLVRWVASGSKVIHVSTKSRRILNEVAAKRRQKGSHSIRWHDLPAPEDALHKEAIIFKWESKQQEGPTYSCISSTGLHFAEEYDHCAWVPHDRPYDEDDVRCLFRPSYNGVLQAISMGIDVEIEKEIERIQSGTVSGQHLMLINLLVTGANCLAALNSEIHVTKRVIPKKRGKRGSRGKRGRRSKQPTIRLDEEGLGVWVSRHEYLDKKHAKEKRKRDRANQPVPFASIDPGRANKWVLEPRPGEKILGMRERRGKKEGVLYLVNRPRKEYTRGELIVVKESRLKCGVDDLIITKIGRDDD